ncbi:hypothetical protein GW17_00031663 [Ensete ventricosum]|nr:hypothetical protein GW17_00031663 [Ensete ventricosum]RZR96366.1 hypothetical protein BHM03_00025372 [Ensete ventricosum]
MQNPTTVLPPIPFQEPKKTTTIKHTEMASVPGAQSRPLLLFFLLMVASFSRLPCSADVSSSFSSQLLYDGRACFSRLILFVVFPRQAVTGPTASMNPVSAVPIDEAKRRRLGNFQICALCTCCGGPRRLCLPSPCCYTINCNIPNRPFGFCSFTPRTCNCFGCHL